MTTTEGTGGGAFANKNCPQGRAFEKNSNARGMPGGLPGGVLAAGIDSHKMFASATLLIVLFMYNFVFVNLSRLYNILI